MQNKNMDRHYAGTFNIGGEEIAGELIYNEESGVTLLNLVKQLTDISAMGKSYGNLEVITGVLNSGTTVTLFHNRCTKNHTQLFQTQQLVFVAEYSIWSKNDAVNVKYNKLECVLHYFFWAQNEGIYPKKKAVKRTTPDRRTIFN